MIRERLVLIYLTLAFFSDGDWNKSQLDLKDRLSTLFKNFLQIAQSRSGILIER